MCCYIHVVLASSLSPCSLGLSHGPKLLFGNGRARLGIRDDSIAAITAVITVHHAQQNLHHCQKWVDIIDLLDFHFHSGWCGWSNLSRLCRSTRLQRLSITWSISRSSFDMISENPKYSKIKISPCPRSCWGALTALPQTLAAGEGASQEPHHPLFFLGLSFWVSGSTSLQSWLPYLERGCGKGLSST